MIETEGKRGRQKVNMIRSYIPMLYVIIIRDVIDENHTYCTKKMNIPRKSTYTRSFLSHLFNFHHYPFKDYYFYPSNSIRKSRNPYPYGSFRGGKLLEALGRGY